MGARGPVLLNTSGTLHTIYRDCNDTEIRSKKWQLRKVAHSQNSGQICVTLRPEREIDNELAAGSLRVAAA